MLYHPPETHPRISESEREMILKDRLDQETAEARTGPRLAWKDLIKLPQTWGVIAARTMTDPVWFFITDWFAIYLVTKGINPEQGLLAFWIPWQLFWRRHLQLADQTRLAGSACTQGRSSVRRTGHDASYSYSFHLKPISARWPFCCFDFCLCFFLNNGARAAFGSLPK